jgi:hypothetical protein
LEILRIPEGNLNLKICYYEFEYIFRKQLKMASILYKKIIKKRKYR